MAAQGERPSLPEFHGGRAGPPEPAADSDGNADASPPTSPEQIYQQATARLAVIIEEWQKARDALLRG
jgi:hypothetical protein